MIKRRNFLPLLVAVFVAAGIGTLGLMTLSSSKSDKFSRPDRAFRETNSRECIDGDFIADASQEVVETYMTAYQWRYSYCSITVYQGQTVVLNLKSSDVPHGFALEGTQIGALIPPESVTTIKFKATEKGEFPYFCTVFCGEGHPNHRGRLIVK